MTATPEQIAERLASAANWMREDKGEDWKSAKGTYDRAPFEAAALIRAQDERVRVLEAEVAKLKRPDWFYAAEDPERSGGDVQDVVDDMDYEGVMEVCGAREVWKKWVAIRCVEVDDHGDIDDTEAVTFDTVEEAERCWPESLAACRARAALKAAP